ncbi:hypothetical protein QP167_08295 [Corynebacterium amycolatum]|uniref:hypothetical protein n=1 Tax=Corynebacterium amycolatum TaxID=43765 RepID=UPI001246DD1D|nr:hypothetical protein [Corynebacterium amycolatum]KAA9246325.1 hypothetical protein F6I30_03705 [Corynebacterium amycolatum]MDK6476427.1 hypothetical protein [Corynebacterium amycolatum]
MTTQTINEHMANLCDLAEHFINQEMPDRAKEGAPWEQVVKDRLAAEIAGNQDYRRVAAALLIERSAGVTISDEDMETEKTKKFLDGLAGIDDFNEIINAVAGAVFDYTMEKLIQAEAVMSAIFNYIEKQENQE